MTDGVLIIDKAEGWTSHDVVARARRLLRERRIGHTGTLDPFATGVLVLLVGRATRLAQFLAGDFKEYEAVIRLGYATETGDLTGARRTRPAEAELTAAENCSHLDAARIEAALSGLRGRIEQTPPMYSAKKIGGRKLYELARRGEEVARAAVPVVVEAFDIIARGENDDPLVRHADGTCDFSARVRCSAGTYVRALAESVGEALKTGAHLAALRRTRAGDFHLRDALTLAGLETKLSEGATLDEILLPLDAALSRMPEVHLTAGEAARARHGAFVPVEGARRAGLADGLPVRLLDEARRLIAVSIYDESARNLRPRVMLASEENKH
ncbi:MAG TPA: tRNA pseudouridine(55) synthase TruB [Pyrinomonadaceae bacterium]|nr:tRNA pseudouridine(55) synthase TruB [Pyrinomonadaceae bacterium]